MEPGKLAAELQQAMNASRKAQDKPRTLLLGTLIAGLRNREIELKHPLSDAEVVEVLRKAVKTRRESVEQYRKGGREDLAGREAAEIAMIEAYLPPDADPAEIRAAVQAAIAAGAGDLGRVMGQVMPKFKGRADGKLINQIVREELQAG
ncbi:MAG: GatB/YqeY domain-containing protein [Gemmatimonadales bacterium]